jgi:predicted NACHT family NTPase
MSVLEVAIGPGPEGYRVDVLRSPDGGEASIVATLDADTILAQRADLQRAVLVSAMATRGMSTEEGQLRAAGRELFRALLGTGEVIGRYRAAERDDDLRIVLRVSDPVLAGLPWEAMYDESVRSYVCRRHQLVRHVVAPVPVAPLTVSPPLRILGVVSSPRDLEPLDVDVEKEHLASALARLTGEGLVELTWAPSATWADLQDMLLSGTWHVVHFVGHGDFDPDRDEGYIFLTGPNGRRDRVEGSRLIDLLRQARPVPRLVVLNSCSGAETGTTDPYSGTAAALVRGGVTAVAAMQYAITDPAAIAFSRGFYGAIARDRGIDEAVSSGRVAILGLSGRTLEWVTPVLYLRGQDSHLFAISATEASPGRANAPKTPPKHAAAAKAEPIRVTIPERTVRTLTGHTASVWGVAFSPDGTLLATASGDKTVRLWLTADGSYSRSLTGHTNSVYEVAFSPDGTLLATGSGDSTVRLWRTVDGAPVRTLTGHRRGVYAVAFSPDGTLLATGNGDQTVCLWRTADGTLARTLTGHTGGVWGVSFGPDGTLLATAGFDSTVRLWRTTDGSHLRTLTGHTNKARDVEFSPDGALLATTSDDQTARLWRTTDGTHLRTLTGHTAWVYAVAFSPDGTLLATTSGDKTVRLWRTTDGTHLRTLTGHASAVYGVAFSPDGTLLATGSHDQTVRLWGAE